MSITTIALANLRRRWGKALFLVAGIAIGVGTVAALITLSGLIQEEIGSQMDRFGANIVVLPKTSSLSLNYGGIDVSGVAFDVYQLRNEDTSRILEIPYRKRLSVVAPKLLTAVEVNGRPVLLAGVDFSAELRLKRWWQIVGDRPRAETDVLLGHDVAKALSIIEPAPDSTVQGVSQTPHHTETHEVGFRLASDHLRIAGRDHRVAGVIKPTGGAEDRMVFGDLRTVQNLASKPGQVSLIEVSALCKDCPVEDIVAQINAHLPRGRASAIQQAVRAREEAVTRLTRFSAVLSVVVLTIGALMIFTTMTSSVTERTKEIGVLRAIGFRKRHVIQGLMIEVTLISVLGGVVGFLCGVVASRLALPYFTGSDGSFEVRLELALAAVGTAVVVAAASSIYPAIRASRLDPSEAIRQV
jgi:putative ABC transport system permease protein